MRTIADTFNSDASAEHARQELIATSVHPDEISVAPAVVSESDDGPIDRPTTIVAVLADGNGPEVRAVLESSGGHVVADVELDV